MPLLLEIRIFCNSEQRVSTELTATTIPTAYFPEWASFHSARSILRAETRRRVRLPFKTEIQLNQGPEDVIRIESTTVHCFA